MTYKETIEYLYTRLPMFSRIGAAAYKEDLHNTIALCGALGDPQSKFKSIHVAGTNGKGSVSHMLAAILQTAGYKTGLYTSPHLKDFRERIKINGEMVGQDFIIDFTARCRPLVEELEPSFFELTVAMAFEYFANQQVDIAIIETGLGGRLDSTNVILPALSVITNIGMDHMQILGDTLEKIAAEKAGIIKPRVPVVIGETQLATKPVFEKTAAEKESPLFFADQLRAAGAPQWEKDMLQVTVTGLQQTDKTNYQLDLAGIYQAKNLLTVLEACSQLQRQGWQLTEEHLHSALRQVKKLTGLHGRWEIIHHAPMLVADVAHNAEGMEQLLAQVKVTPHEKLHIIIGMVKDKDIFTSLSKLPAAATYYFTKAEIPRALPAEALQSAAARFGLKGETYSSVNTAIYAASLDAGKKDLIIICGSIFLVGEVSLRSIRSIWKSENNMLQESEVFWEALRFFD